MLSSKKIALLALAPCASLFLCTFVEKQLIFRYMVRYTTTYDKGTCMSSEKELIFNMVHYDPTTGLFTSKNRSKYSNREVGARIGTLHKLKGYRYISLLGKTYREQRLAVLLMTGEWPPEQVDHINRVKDDNRWTNLRCVSPSENCWNRGLSKNNTSGYTGVCWHKKENKWQVLCRSSGKQVFLGLYTDAHEAGRAASEYYAAIR